VLVCLGGQQLRILKLFLLLKIRAAGAPCLLARGSPAAGAPAPPAARCPRAQLTTLTLTQTTGSHRSALLSLPASRRAPRSP
jgi:hypothetical protein